LSTNLQKLALRTQLIRNCAVPLLIVMLSATAFRASAQTAPRLNSGGSTPLLFEANNVAGSPVRYIARTADYTVFLSDDEADVVLQEEKAPSKELQRGGLIVVQAHASLLRIRFVDANPPTSISPAGEENGLHPSLAAVAYRGIYPGTDVIVRGDQQRMQFQVKLGPGASTENIVIEFAGATGLDLQADGTAVVHAGSASLLLQRPLILFGNNQTSQSAPADFRIENGNRLRLVFGASASSSSQIIGD
jgi:hypothetical protein